VRWQWALIVGLVLAAAGVFLDLRGQGFIGFARDAWRESKVVWPTRKETMQMTLYVFVCGGDGLVLVVHR
jgi:preprotein translocase subunit SecE